jgi:hypothetical protein
MTDKAPIDPLLLVCVVVGCSRIHYPSTMSESKMTINQIRVVDLINSGLLESVDEFRFMTGNVFRGPTAKLLPDGNFEIEGEGVFSSPSSLASHISGGKSYNGWQVIARVSDGLSLDRFRHSLIGE